MSDAEFLLAEIDRHRKKSRGGRIVLLVLSSFQLALALPWLFGDRGLWTGGDATPEHLTRDGALGLIFALAGLAVAQSPKRAWFALPLVLVLTCIQTFFGVFDHRHANAVVGFELVHLLGAAIGVSVALFVKPSPRRKPRRSPLRIVGERE